MTDGLLVVVPNFALTPGKWMGSNFVLSLLRSEPFRKAGVEMHVVARAATAGTLRDGAIVVHHVQSASPGVEPFQRYGRIWSGEERPAAAEALRARALDAWRVSRATAALLPGVRSALWWTEPQAPLGNLAAAWGRMRGRRSLFVLANYQRRHRAHDLLLRAALGGFSAVVTPSHALGQRIAALPGHPPQPETIPLAIDRDAFGPPTAEERRRLRRAHGLPEDATVVAWFGPIIPPSRIEDVRLLLDAIPAIRRRAPNTTFIFAFKYGVPQRLGQSPDGARLLSGYGDIRDVYRMADVAALPFTDPGAWVTTPLSMIEALACGVPVVTMDRPGLDEVVDVSSGILVRAPGKFAEELAALCADPARRARLSDGALTRARERFDLAPVARRYAELLLG